MTAGGRDGAAPLGQFIPADTGGLDIDCAEFAVLLESLDYSVPVSDRYEARKGRLRPGRVNYQREHMITWFAAQTTRGSGDYTRRTPNRSSRRAYNRLQSAGGLLWMAELLGADPVVVQQAADAAFAEPDQRTRCKVVRSFLPWELTGGLAAREIRRIRKR